MLRPIGRAGISGSAGVRGPIRYATGSDLVPMLAMGMGNPLQAGTYYIGVQDPNNASSYTLQSRGIGLTNYTIRVKDLGFNGSTTNPELAVTEGDYYRVQVPGNAPDWKLQLHANLGRCAVESAEGLPAQQWPGGARVWRWDNAYGGQLMMKPGDEQWALLPQNNYYAQEGTNLTAGTYYVLVASQGQNLVNNCYGPGSGWGSGSASYTLEQLDRAGDGVAEHLELWQRSAVHQCAGGRGDEVLPVQCAGGDCEH
jgi:hypothetical protein